MRDLVQSYVFSQQESDRFGIKVPDAQVAISLAQVQQAFQEKGQFSPRLYGQALQYELHLTPQEFEEEQRRSIAFYKLRWLIQSCIKVTDKEFEMLLAQTPSEEKPNVACRPRDSARSSLAAESDVVL